MNGVWSVLSGRSVCIVFVALLLSVVADAAYVHVAGASAAPPSLNVSPHGNYSDGQTVTVAAGPNSYFTPHSRVNILECADPGGLATNLPKDNTTCDGNTIQGSTILVAADGSFSESAYLIYLLPSPTLGEQSNNRPICNEANYCVLYVGQNQNDFTAPKVFSAPFLIAPSAGSTTTTATSAQTSGSPGATSTTAAPTTSSATAGTVAATSLAQSATGSAALANTGPPGEIAWVAALAMTLLLTGALGRRLVLRRDR